MQISMWVEGVNDFASTHKTFIEDERHENTKQICFIVVFATATAIWRLN
jgi:hypothetical protein